MSTRNAEYLAGTESWSWTVNQTYLCMYKIFTYSINNFDNLESCCMFYFDIFVGLVRTRNLGLFI